MTDDPMEALARELEQVKQDRAELVFAIRQGDFDRAKRVLHDIDRRMGWA